MFFGISLVGVDFFLYLCARFVRARLRVYVRRAREAYVLYPDYNILQTRLQNAKI